MSHSSFNDAKKASAAALSNALRIPESVCNVSLSIVLGTCNLKVGIAIPWSYARFSTADVDLQAGIERCLYKAGHKTATVVLDQEVEVVEHVPLQKPIKSCSETWQIDGSVRSHVFHVIMLLHLCFLWL